MGPNFFTSARVNATVIGTLADARTCFHNIILWQMALKVNFYMSIFCTDICYKLFLINFQSEKWQYYSYWHFLALSWHGDRYWHS